MLIKQRDEERASPILRQAHHILQSAANKKGEQNRNPRAAGFQISSIF
jgi:hypothetical protein